MKFYVLPADSYGCGHYRLIWPAIELQKMGHDVQVMAASKTSGFLARTERDDNGNERLIGVQVPEDADGIVIQRPAHPLQPQMINIMRSNGIAVIVDMDDDMGSIHPDNKAYHVYRHSSGSPLSWRYADLSCRIASMVTVSTPQLLKVYASHGRGRVIHNYVPNWYLDNPRIPSGMFGWAGTTGSHPNDLQVTAPAAQKLIDDGYQFQVIGGGNNVQSVLRLRHPPMQTGPVPMQEYITGIAMGLDVGWAPLAPTSFNTSKSRLKPLEFMASGTAWVGSPRAEYRTIHRESGCGLLADTPKQWYNYTKELLNNASLREEQIEAGLAYAETQTYEKHAWRWAEAWEEAAIQERKRVGKE